MLPPSLTSGIKGELDHTETTVIVLGSENVFVSTTTLGANAQAAHDAAPQWLQDTPGESADEK